MKYCLYIHEFHDYINFHGFHEVLRLYVFMNIMMLKSDEVLTSLKASNYKVFHVLREAFDKSPRRKRKKRYVEARV